MNHNHSNTNTISPFLEGIARNFDFAGSLDYISPPLKNEENPILNDWMAVGSDYQNSMKIINEEFYGTKRNPKNKS
jgi:hypothetical protein